MAQITDRSQRCLPVRVHLRDQYRLTLDDLVGGTAKVGLADVPVLQGLAACSACGYGYYRTGCALVSQPAGQVRDGRAVVGVAAEHPQQTLAAPGLGDHHPADRRRPVRTPAGAVPGHLRRVRESAAGRAVPARQGPPRPHRVGQRAVRRPVRLRDGTLVLRAANRLLPSSRCWTRAKLSAVTMAGTAISSGPVHGLDRARHRAALQGLPGCRRAGP